MNLGQSDKSAFSVTIQLSVRSATFAVRFPCLLSLQWRTNNQKVNLETAKYSPQGGRTDFNEDLIMRTEIAFDRGTRRFLKKETQVQLNLVSKSRPDQSKLVGRVTIDLANILNDHLYAEPTEFPLQFCSVNASLVMAFKVLEQVQTELSVSELEMSLGEGSSFSSALRLASGASSNMGGSGVKERQLAGISSEISPVSNNKVDLGQAIKKEITPAPSPVQAESVTNVQPSSKKEAYTKQARQTIPQQKPVTRSFKSIQEIKESMYTRKSEVTEDLSQQIDPRQDSKKSSFRKMGSVSSEDGRVNESGRLSQDLNKQKMETDKIRMEADRYKQQAQLHRLHLQKVKQQLELTKLELKQKKNTVDFSATQANSLKTELTRTREQLSKSREESVSLTLKLAQLREAHNKSLVQATLNERELVKMQGISQKLQSLLREKEQLQNLNNSLQTELSEYQSRCEQLQLQKNELKSTLSNLDQMHQQALSKCTENEQALSEHKGSFETEIRVLKEQLKNETKQRMEKEKHIEQLNQEIQRLINVANEFDQARHSWEITESLNKEENEHKNARIKQLEDNIISLDERVRWLQGENELLTENARKNREDYLKIKSQKENEGGAAAEQIKKYQQTLQKLNDQKKYLQGQVSAMQELTLQLQQQCDELKNANDSQAQTIVQLQTSFAEVGLKNHELQQLVLNINQLRDKEKHDNAEKQMGFIVKVAQLEGSNRQLEQLVQANAQRVALIQEELKGREALIIRLQQGLRTQVQRSEQLNNRVMHFLEKEERMKETLVLLEMESKRIGEMLIEQQIKEEHAQQVFKQLSAKNAELTVNLQESIQYGKSLEELSKSNENSANAKIFSLTKELEKKTLQIAQNKLTIQSKSSKIKEIEEQYAQLQAQERESSLKNQKKIEQLKNQLSILQSSIQEVEAALSQKSNKLVEVQAELSSKHSQLTERITSIDRQTVQFEKLCGQLREIELNHQRQIQASQERYLQIVNKYQQLENISSIKHIQHGENVAQLQQQIVQLQQKLDSLTKDNTAQAIASLKKQIKQKNDQIKHLENQLKSANVEAAKVPNLERSLKIKNIELNSLKFKGKNDGFEGNELLRLKDQEISALTAEKERLLACESELQTLRQKSEALATELQLIQQQKFNIESQSNERALMLEQARQQNKKLMDQITIIGERNGELQKTLQDLLNKDSSSKGNSKGDASLKAQITLLRGQIKQLQVTKQKVLELQQARKKLQEQLDLKQQQHMIALIDQQFKLTKSESQNGIQNVKKSTSISRKDSQQTANIPNLVNTYKSLKQIIDQRIKNKNHQKLIEFIDNLLAQNELKQGILFEKSRQLSKEFQKLKLQVMKFDGKAAQQKLKLVNLFKGYETLLSQVVRLSDFSNN